MANCLFAVPVEPRCQQAVVCRFDGKFANGGDADVDRHRAEAAGLEGRAPGTNGGLREAGPRLQLVLLKEFIEPQIVDALGDWR